MPFLQSLFISGGVGILVLLVALVLVFKLARRLFPYALAAAVIAVALSVFFGINVLSEARTLATTFPSAQNLFLLHENGRLLAGFDGTLVNAEALRYLNEEQLLQLRPAVETHDFAALRGSYFRVVLIGAQAFAPEQLEDIRAADTRERLITALLAEQGAQDTPETRELLQRSLEQRNITADSEARGLLFTGLAAHALEENNLFLIAGSAEGTVAIEPETITFKIAKSIPSFIIDSLE